ncbi:MAG: DotD/TraH family lipoprotein [Chromatiales bacterium]|jgi:defect-in-organelle-trafficking protein DotD
MKKSALSLTVFALLSGCANHKPVVVADKAPDPALVALKEAAEQVSQSFELVAALEQAKSAAPSFAQPNDPALRKRISMPYWHGPMDKAVRAVAKEIGYSVRVMGRKPPVDALISVNFNQTPAWDVLRNIGLQAGKRSGIVINANMRTLTIHYKDAKASEG